MNFQSRLSLFCCTSACILTISIPLISEATAGGYGAQSGRLQYPNDSETAGVEYIYVPISDIKKSDAGPLSSPPAEYDASQDDTAEKEKKPDTEIPEVTYVRLKDDSGNITDVSLEDYITCVVAAEMPYTFNTEALKAQAVAARSYCVYKMEHGSGHDGDADVCTSSSHCAAYITMEQLTKKYGESTAKKIWKKVSDAVNATAGEIITYNGKTALALFHSRSYEYTESSENVWGGKYPYLVSVSTPEDDSVSTVTVTDDTLRSVFGTDTAVQVSASSKPTLTSVINANGRQSIMTYSGKSIKAKTLRSKLGLKSTDFTYAKTEKGYVFTVHGYGHGVGMSQYGANAMANAGSDYSQILSHYYPGTKLKK